MLYYTFTDGVYLVRNVETGELVDQFNTCEDMKEVYPEIEEF